MDNGGSGSDVKREEGAQDVQDRLEGLREQAEDAGKWIREFARERPVAAIAIAAGIGFLVGRLVSRT